MIVRWIFFRSSIDGSSKPFLDEDSSINRPSNFISECYYFWKIRTKIFIESNDVEIWNVVEEGPFIPSITIDGKEQP